MNPPGEDLSAAELAALVRRVFRPRPEDSAIAILVDLPDERTADHDAWARRRAMARRWAAALAAESPAPGLPVRLVYFRNTGSNNGDLPERAWIAPADGPAPPERTADLLDAPSLAFDEILGSHSIVLAPTEFSATAPLKLAAPRLGLRAATMPGFTPAMIPALRLDYGEVNRRVETLRRLLDRAVGAAIRFRHPGGECSLEIDLRFRAGHASGGLVSEPGTAGNLPSGEAYIVPYEGERQDLPSATRGLLPVELRGEVVVYRVEANRAVEAHGDGPAAAGEAARLAGEPAYGNIAELGLGVLADFGVQPVGSVLLDEKLGLHIAFGRSDHFGGQVGPAQFSGPAAVVHIDRVYVPACQPRVAVPAVDLVFADGLRLGLMRDGRYAPGIFTAAPPPGP